MVVANACVQSTVHPRQKEPPSWIRVLPRLSSSCTSSHWARGLEIQLCVFLEYSISFYTAQVTQDPRIPCSNATQFISIV